MTSDKSENIVLIPSAKFIPENLQESFGKIPSCLMPVSGIPVIHFLIKAYIRNNYRVVIIGKQGIHLIRNLLNGIYEKVEIIELDEIGDLGYTVGFGLEYALKQYKSIKGITVNFADTLLEDMTPVFNTTDSLFYSYVYESVRWTVFDFQEKKITWLSDKKELEGSSFKGIIGLFNFSDAHVLLDCFRRTDFSKESNSFYDALLEYNQIQGIQFVHVEDWQDVGHKDKYLNTKKELQARYFNSISIDEARGILTKKSMNKEKFRNEIYWYLKLPSGLKYSAPSIYTYSLDYGAMSVSMEYYGYTTLNELFVYGNLNRHTWEDILKKIFFITEDFKGYAINGQALKKQEALDNMYRKKTVERLNQLKENKLFNRFFSGDIHINESVYPSLEAIIENLENYISLMELDVDPFFTIIHGDFGFSNILYDVNSGIVRLIDPRGSFGEFDIYGDSRYDLAKLSHSINSKYDFIINDLFYVDTKLNGINYKIRTTENSELVGPLFRNYFSEKEYRKIRFIESLLFLSMPPLHADYPDRQIVMLATGIELLHNIINHS